MSHPAARSLSKEEATRVYSLTREIMDNETLSSVALDIKAGVWSTNYLCRGVRDRRTFEMIISEERIQLGGKLLTGSLIPRRIYWISPFESKPSLVIVSYPRHKMLATIVASTTLEEIAHAIVTRKTGYISIKPHGTPFYTELLRLMDKYFMVLQVRLQGIYGSEGEY